MIPKIPEFISIILYLTQNFSQKKFSLATTLNPRRPFGTWLKSSKCYPQRKISHKNSLHSTSSMNVFSLFSNFQTNLDNREIAPKRTLSHNANQLSSVLLLKQHCEVPRDQKKGRRTLH